MASNFTFLHNGVNIGVLSADPSNPINGDMYYNSTSNLVRAYMNGAWTSIEPNAITALTGDVTATGPGSAATSLVATTNSTLTTLSALSLPATQLTGTLQAAQEPAHTGDVTNTAGSLDLTLATVNSNVGSFGSSTAIPSVTVNAKGLVTAASTNVVVAPAGTLTGSTLASNVTATSITSVGTIGTGTWQGSQVTVDYGGTGLNSISGGAIPYGNSATTLSTLAEVDNAVIMGAGGNPTYTTNPTLGTAGSVSGTVGIANGGASGAYVTFRNRSTTTNYNFNLPSSAGSAGQVLTSQGGATNDMTWSSVSASTTGDIDSGSFSGANNQSSAANVTGLAFANASVRSFSAQVSVYVNATTSLYEAFRLDAIQNGTGWYISNSSVGDVSGVVFSITSAGQIQYTSSNYTGFSALTMKFRAQVLPI